MVESLTADGQDPGLAAFLRERARHTSHARVALDIGIGLAAIVTAVTMRPVWRLQLACAGATFLAFALWAVLDRISISRPEYHGLSVFLAVARWVLAFVGIGAAIALGFLLWASLLGPPWIL